MSMSTKDLLRTPAIEDYSKAIFALESRKDEPVSTNALAERLGHHAGLGIRDAQAARRARPRHTRALPRECA
jgi:hypothetical protein